MKNLLSYSSYRVMSNFYASEANESFSVWKEVVKNIWECNMNFNQMVKKLGPSIKSYRPTWGEGELLWKKDQVLVHNTPYWGGEMINQFLDGYPYVCEKQDVESNDWILVKDEEVKE